MLSLVGLGLDNEKDLTLKGVETLKKCDEVYLEAYTSKATDLNKKRLEELIGNLPERIYFLAGMIMIQTPIIRLNQKRH